MKWNPNQLFLILFIFLFISLIFSYLQYKTQKEKFNLTAAFIDLATYGGIDSYLYGISNPNLFKLKNKYKRNKRVLN